MRWTSFSWWCTRASFKLLTWRQQHQCLRFDLPSNVFGALSPKVFWRFSFELKTLSVSWFPGTLPQFTPPIQKSTSPSCSRLCWQGLLSMAAKEFNHHSHCLKCTANTWFPDVEIGGWVPRNLSSFHASLFELLDFLFCPQLRILLAADSPSSMSILTRHAAAIAGCISIFVP